MLDSHTRAILDYLNKYGLPRFRPDQNAEKQRNNGYDIDML